MVERWKLVGYDTFADEEYPIADYLNEEEARKAAYQRLLELEGGQPSISSGGQAEDGIQDRVFIERPDGTRYKFIPPELKSEL